MAKQIILRSEALTLGLSRYFTGKPCIKGHISERITIWRHCVRCANDRRWELRKSTPERRAKWRVNVRRKQTKTPESRRKKNRQAYLSSMRSINGRISKYLRNRMYTSVRRGSRSGSAVRDLGCSIPEFRAYIEARFSEGMTWSNYGEWHLDHKKPLALCRDKTNREELLPYIHYTNYQPLWAGDNIRKGSRYDAVD